MKAKIKAHYHWIIAAVILLEMTVYGGVLNNAGLFLVPVTQSLQISRGSYSLSTSLCSVVSFLSILCSGIYFKRYGYKKCLIVSLAVAALAQLTYSVSSGLLPLCIAALLFGTARGSCFSNGSSYVIGTWFHKHYGLIMGIVSAATGLGGGLGSLLLSGVITDHGWRVAYRVSGALLAGTALIALLLVQNRPTDMGLQPYGEGIFTEKLKKKAATRWEGPGMEAAKRKPSFYLLLAITFLSCLCYYSGSATLVPYFQDCGMSLNQAASIKSIMLFLMAGVKILLGWLSDRIGAKKIALICSTATVLSLLLLSSPNLTTAYLASILLSVAAPVATIVITLLVPELFGHRASQAGMGYFLSLAPLSNMAANLLLNTLHDRLGSYRPVYSVSAIVATGIVALYPLLFAMTKADRKQQP